MFVGTKNFTPAEVACKCGCGMLPDAGFMNKVQGLRDYVGSALKPTSGARCPAYNAKVSETGATGPHTTGHAIDFETRGTEAYKVANAAFRLGFSGIGINQKGDSRFVHIDDLPNMPGCPRPRIWSY